MVRGWARSRLGGIWILGICVVVFAGAALIASSMQATRYTATSRLVFRGRTYGETLLGRRLTPEIGKTGPTPEAIEAVITAPVVPKITAEALPGDHSPTEIADKIDVRVDPGNDAIALTATDADPESAALIANTYAEQAAALFRVLAEKRVGPAIQAAQGDEGKIARLIALEALQLGEIEQVEAATPPSGAASTHILTDTLFGALLGLAIGAALTILLAQANRKVGETRAVEDELGTPVITAFGDLDAPQEEGEGGAGVAELPIELVEMLRARIRYYGADRSLGRLMLTSPDPDAGGSTVAWNLAKAANAAAVRSIVIELDAFQTASADGEASEPSDRVFDRLESDGYDLVLLDAGPYPGNEARQADMFRNVDGVIAVVRVDSAGPGQVRRLGDRLRENGAPLIGAVATYVSDRDAYAAALNAGQAEPHAAEVTG
jgi:Mrp family chromosome partitioning ATPase